MTIGEKALTEVAEMLTDSWQRRAKLRANGWKRILNPPLVNNEWFWEHPLFGRWTESLAIANWGHVK
ncbi:MAG: hypothetical protein M0R80_01365 [Proteobacteria bacterium]|jgi:hypothetical protein|nr:hypothetical protein [Pseudomonadota bacterium]